MTKIHNLTGIITRKELRKVYNKESPYRGNIHYRLSVVLENDNQASQSSNLTNLFIYPNVASPEIFSTIEQSQFIDKRYLFFCQKKKKG
jgi:hypothetical protein